MDALNHKIERLLEDAKLPTHAWAMDRLREDIEIAQALAAEPPERRRLPNREAKTLANAAERVLRAAAKHNLASREDLRIVRRLKRLAELDLLLPAFTGPDVRPWLWACCQNFLETWRDLAIDPETGTRRPHGLWERGLPSPALAFLEACSQLVDPTVNTSAILTARDAAGPEASDEERMAAYEEWSNDPIAKKLRKSDD